MDRLLAHRGPQSADLWSAARDQLRDYGLNPIAAASGDLNCGRADMMASGLRAKQRSLFICGWMESIEFREAAHIWGKDTYETQELVKQGTVQKGNHVAVIGPAAENGVLFAGIYCDHGRAAARTGLGAVMGAKNLKAIAVHGDEAMPLVNPNLYSSFRSESNRALKQDNQAHVFCTSSGLRARRTIRNTWAQYRPNITSRAVLSPLRIFRDRAGRIVVAGQSACHACVILWSGRAAGRRCETQRPGI